ncbi:hypothetical protein ASZ90_014891 [hydrocarbon metagenome]|uniref:Uncharacterized protein n=1 Tax=hydrocarbon metagenome TaxID=938273 RepID=A0A0W8F3Z6_9ZZZZ
MKPSGYLKGDHPGTISISRYLQEKCAFFMWGITISDDR